VTAYEDGKSALGIEGSNQWVAARKKISGRVTPREQATAAKVMRNIEAEEMLCGEGESPDPDLFAAVLRTLSKKGWPDPDPEFAKAYDGRVAEHALSGRALAEPPRTVYRFVSATSLFGWIVRELEASEGAAGMAHTLRTMLNDAQSEVPTVEWSELEKYVLAPERWSVFKDRVKLTLRPSQFVTFESKPGQLEGDAEELFERLGPEPHEEMTGPLVVVKYETTAEDELRFPTFADAGWRGQFKGVRAPQSHGWTISRDPTMEGVPEACEPPQTLARVVPVSSNFCVRD